MISGLIKFILGSLSIAIACKLAISVEKEKLGDWFYVLRFMFYFFIVFAVILALITIIIYIAE